MTTTWRWLLTGADLLVLLLIAYCAARVINLLTTGYLAVPQPIPKMQESQVMVHSQTAPIESYKPIYERDLFNHGSASVVETAGEELKPTELNVKLWGIAATKGGKQAGYAIIEDLLTHKQALYRVGDVVADQATLKRVERKRVILSREGEDEVLELTPYLSPQDSARVAASGAAAARIRKAGENKYLIDRREIEEVMQNLNKVFTQARAVPYFQNGKTVGFRVFAIHHGSIFEKIGLKNGDVIQSINGIDLTDPTRALALFQELQGERHISVDLMRNKLNQNMSYEIR